LELHEMAGGAEGGPLKARRCFGIYLATGIEGAVAFVLVRSPH